MFRTSSPVSGSEFFDREDDLADLVQRVERLRAGAPSWLALLGRRKIGKSSLLLELTRRCASDDVVVAMLDSFEISPLGPDVLRRYALRVVDRVLARRVGGSLEARSRSPADYRATLRTVIGALADDTARFVTELPELKPDAITNRLCLELPEQLAEAFGLYVVVAWDGFQAIASIRGGRGREDLLPLMRSVWQRHRRVEYIVSGSERSALAGMLVEPRAPFFQHFAIRELGVLPEAAARRLLVDCAPRGRRIPVKLAERAADLLDRHPFYLQLLGDELTLGPPPYDADALKRSIQSLLFSRTGRLSLFFEAEHARLVGSATTLAATLNAVAERPRTLTELATEIGAPTGATHRYLVRLGDAVERVDDRWHIGDPVFALWLRWRRPGGTATPMTLLGDEGERRAAEHLASLGFDLVYQSRASRGAFDLLAIRGARQLGVQVRRRALPLRFTGAEWRRMGSDAVRFGWRWVVVAVSPEDHSVLVLDPARTRGTRERTLHADAAISNLLDWIERPAE
jgi:AAA+ ATPase superfamily predicted ATPase